MPLNPNGYPLDLTGLALTNKIVDEEHMILTGADLAFVPSAGPYYTESLVVRNASTNALLQPNVHYKAVHLYAAGSMESGNNVSVVVSINSEYNIPGVLITYQCMGGVHSDTGPVIRQLLDTFGLPSNFDEISWNMIIGAPSQYTPVLHLHDIRDTYGWFTVVAMLEQIRIAILNGDGPAFDALFTYIHTYIQNMDFATQNDLQNTFSNIPFYEIKSFPDYAAMRQATTMINNAPAVYACLGRDGMFDGKGRFFYWDIASTAIDDNDLVIRPTIIPINMPGRFITMQRVEKDLELLASSVQRKINYDGTIEDSMINNSSIVVGDCDDYVRAGTYWVGDNNLIANAPFSWCVLKVDNVNVDSGNDVIGEVVHTFYDGYGNKATRMRYYNSGTTSFEWSIITYYARRNGDENINFNVKDAYAPNHAITLNQYIRGIECFLGFIPVYHGAYTVLRAAAISDTTEHISTLVPNSDGTWSEIFISSIEDLSPPFFSARLVAIYLELDYDNMGGNRLNWTSAPEDVFLNFTGSSYSKGRKPSFIGGNLILGVAYVKDNAWEMVRNWFQDPGLLQHKGFYNSPRNDITLLPLVNGPLAILDYDDNNVNNTVSPVFISPFYNNSYLSPVEMIVWNGEMAEFLFEVSYTVDSTTAGIKKAYMQLVVFKLDPVSGLGTLVCNNTLPALSRGTTNENSNDIIQHGTVTCKFVADQTAIYTAGLYVGTEATDVRLYMRGRQSNPFSRSRLQLSLSQYMAYSDLRIYSIVTPGVTRTVNLTAGENGVDVFNKYVAAYGPLSNTPNLEEIRFVLSSINHGGINVLANIPETIRVVIVIDQSYLVGPGGTGGYGTGTDVATRSGGAGGDAIFGTRGFRVILRYSAVLGGGGGGGGGGVRQDQPQQAGYAGGGGGGAGLPPGNGGQVQTTGIANGDGVGQPGAVGNLTDGGLGGTTTYTNTQNGDFSKGGEGGGGGDLGQPGQPGTIGVSHYGSSGVGLGGVAGKAIHTLNTTSPVIIEHEGGPSGGTIYGAVSVSGGVQYVVS